MGSEWTDESVIRRDLSLAQGQWVPCGIDAVVAGEKPPTYVITEETEEEYYKHWTADGDFSTGPDLSLIKKMLEMMNDEAPEEDVPARSSEIEIVKANPKPPFTLKKKAAKERPPEQRRARNAAIASLLAIQQATEIPIRLSKPDDFIKPNKGDIDALKRKNESVKKVNNWLHTQNLNSMFRKKSNKENDNENVESNVNVKKDRIGSEKRDGKCISYTPSSFAREYYETCVKRSHMAQIVNENIWARAEKMMKEIDERKDEQIRKQQEVESALNAVLDAADEEIRKKTLQNGDSEDSEKNKAGKDFTAIEKIELPQHRHQLTGECVVCSVLVKNYENNKKIRKSSPEMSTEESEDSEEDKVNGRRFLTASPHTTRS